MGSYAKTLIGYGFIIDKEYIKTAQKIINNNEDFKEKWVVEISGNNGNLNFCILYANSIFYFDECEISVVDTGKLFRYPPFNHLANLKTKLLFNKIPVGNLEMLGFTAYW